MDSAIFALAGVSDAWNQERLITPELHQQVKSLKQRRSLVQSFLQSKMCMTIYIVAAWPNISGDDEANKAIKL